MVTSLFVAAVLAATPLPEPKLAAPGLDGLNLTKEEVDFYSEHFATQFTFEGVKVTTASQIGAVVGMQRQKELLGCGDNGACMTELANALGVDGILTGSIAKLEDAYQLNLKIVSADDASNLATYSSQISGQKNLVNELTRAAKVMAGLMKDKLRARAARDASAAQTTSASGTGTNSTATTSAGTVTAGNTASASRVDTAGASSPTTVTSTAPSATTAPRARHTRITVGPLLILFGQLPVEVEHAVSPGTSIAVGAALAYPSVFGLAAGQATLGVSGTLELRLFPLQDPAPSGLWFGPQLFGSYSAGTILVEATGQYADQENIYVGMNLMLGYTRIWDNGITASIGAGLGGRYFFETVSTNPGPAFSAALHANLGYAF